jgi:hypothetical protein
VVQAGIYFRSDIGAGVELGQRVTAKVIEQISDDRSEPQANPTIVKT